MIEVRLHVHSPEDILLAGRAAQFLLRNPDREDALLEYGEDRYNTFWVKRNKSSISVWQQGVRRSGR